jgi:hypothetical protein
MFRHRRLAGNEQVRPTPEETPVRMPSWDTLRVVIAFLVAPLACPLIFYLYVVTALPPGPDHPSYYQNLFLFVVGGSTLGVYFYVIVLGIPIYLSMRHYNLTSFWLAPLVGYIAGAVSILLIGMPRPFSNPELTALALKGCGPIGAVVCTIFWLIARPDLRSHDAKRGNTASEP